MHKIAEDERGYCTDKCRQKVTNGHCFCLNRNPFWFPDKFFSWYKRRCPKAKPHIRLKFVAE